MGDKTSLKHELDREAFVIALVKAGWPRHEAEAEWDADDDIDGDCTS